MEQASLRAGCSSLHRGFVRAVSSLRDCSATKRLGSRLNTEPCLPSAKQTSDDFSAPTDRPSALPTVCKPPARAPARLLARPPACPFVHPSARPVRSSARLPACPPASNHRRSHQDDWQAQDEQQFCPPAAAAEATTTAAAAAAAAAEANARLALRRDRHAIRRRSRARDEGRRAGRCEYRMMIRDCCLLSCRAACGRMPLLPRIYRQPPSPPASQRP